MTIQRKGSSCASARLGHASGVADDGDVVARRAPMTRPLLGELGIAISFAEDAAPVLGSL